MTIYTLAAISRVLGVPEAEIRHLTAQGVIRDGKAGENRYLLEETARELLAHYREGPAEEETADYQNERALLMRVKRKNAEYDLKLREKDLHESTDIELVLSQMLVSFKAKLSALPTKLTPQLTKMTDGVEIYDLLKAAIDETQEELADYDALFREETEEESS